MVHFGTDPLAQGIPFVLQRTRTVSSELSRELENRKIKRAATPRQRSHKKSAGTFRVPWHRHTCHHFILRMTKPYFGFFNCLFDGKCRTSRTISFWVALYAGPWIRWKRCFAGWLLEIVHGHTTARKACIEAVNRAKHLTPGKTLSRSHQKYLRTRLCGTPQEHMQMF